MLKWLTAFEWLIPINWTILTQGNLAGVVHFKEPVHMLPNLGNPIDGFPQLLFPVDVKFSFDRLTPTTEDFPLDQVPPQEPAQEAADGFDVVWVQNPPEHVVELKVRGRRRDLVHRSDDIRTAGKYE